jgi:hypothetical protein
MSLSQHKEKNEELNIIWQIAIDNDYQHSVIIMSKSKNNNSAQHTHRT